ncbi:MAG: TadE/TadG family type IV pilus assembly protein [Acidimicrobiales bacterium]
MSRRRPAPGRRPALRRRPVDDRQRARGGERGQATAELALVLPLVATLLLALVQAAVVARDQVLVAHAAREAARVAAVDEDVESARLAAEQAGPLATDRLDVEVTGRGEAGSRVRVVVRYTLPTRLPLIGRALDDVTLTASATMRVER